MDEQRLTDQLAQKFPDVEHSINERPDTIHVGMVRVPEDRRGQGMGTQFMNHIIDYSKEKNKPVFLTPEKIGGQSTAALDRWYKSLGFKPNKGRAKDYRSTASRVREPKADGGDVDGITAYHGSPHDFDEFDTSKIGTGEGAQAYGHGLYFAEHEPVAKGYRDELSKNRPLPLQIDGERHYPYTRMQRMVAEHRGDVDAVLAKMEPNWGYAISDHASLPHDADEFERMLVEDAAKDAHKERAEVEAMRGKSVGYGKPGHMYEVHINAHPHHMLDWDKDVSEQHPHILDAINKLIPKDEEHRGGLQEFVANPDDYAGGAIIDYLHSAYGTKKTSEMLHSAGIKGIKYLDAGSRSDESKQTHNYVVFDHKDVRVKRKYERGGAVDNDVIPHSDPKREQNLTAFHGKTPDEIKNTRWYHGTPSSFDKFNKGHKGIFVTKDPEFAHEFMHNYSDDEDQHEKLANHAKNIMPLHVKAENPFDYENADHVNKLMPHIPSHMRNSTVKENLQAGAWDELEHPDVQKAIKKLGHDSYFVNEDGNKNLALYDPTQIKSATGNNGNFDPSNPDITKAEGGEVDDHYIGEHYQDGGEVDPPKKKVKAYKLFRTDPKAPGKIFPLFVDSATPVPVKKWVGAKDTYHFLGDNGRPYVPATTGVSRPIPSDEIRQELIEQGFLPKSSKAKAIKVVAYRPGWHAGDLPVATHIGGGGSPPTHRPDNHVWAEVEMPHDVDWQSEADSRMEYTKTGKPKLETAHITDQVPLGGHYRYKTNPNMTGNWLIGGSMKVNRILKDDEVKAINDANGVADLPRLPRAPETKARGGPIATSGPIVKRALELLSKDRTGR